MPAPETIDLSIFKNLEPSRPGRLTSGCHLALRKSSPCELSKDLVASCPARFFEIMISDRRPDLLVLRPCPKGGAKCFTLNDKSRVVGGSALRNRLVDAGWGVGYHKARVQDGIIIVERSGS